jgi:hypothetical protein
MPNFESGLNFLVELSMPSFPITEQFDPVELEKFVDFLIEKPQFFCDLINPGYAAPLPIINLKYLPELPGIYLVAETNEMALSNFKQILYIGYSNVSIRQRWTRHHKMQLFNLLETRGRNYKTEEEQFFRIGIFYWVNPFASEKFLKKLERLLIDKIKPPCNNLKIGKNRDSDIEEIFEDL